MKLKPKFEFQIAILLFALIPLFAKLIQLSADAIIMFRSAIAAVALLFFIWFGRQKLVLNSRKDYGWVLLIGLLMGIHWIAFFFSIQLSTVAVAMIALFTYPIISTFLEPLFFKEKLRWMEIVNALLIFVGVTLIIPEFSLKNEMTLGIVVGLVSSFTLSVRNILSRKYIASYSGSLLLFYQMLVVTVMSLGVVLYNGSTVVGTPKDWGLLILLGVVFSAFAHNLYIRALKHLTARSMGVLAGIQPLYSVIFAFFLLNEVPSLRTLLGGALVVGAVILESLAPAKN